MDASSVAFYRVPYMIRLLHLIEIYLIPKILVTLSLGDEF